MALLSPKVGEALYLNNAGGGPSPHTYGPILLERGGQVMERENCRGKRQDKEKKTSNLADRRREGY